MYFLKESINLFLIKIDWSYFKYNDLLDTLNLYKTLRKEHQVVDFLVTDKTSALEILVWKYLKYVPLI